MSYYLGTTTDLVKPITRRTTWTRPMFSAIRRQRYLMQPGRCPVNRPGYPTAGRPVRVTPQLATWRTFRGLTRPTLGTILPLDLEVESGRELGALTDFFKVPALTTSFTPAPAVSPLPAPVASSSSFWNPIASLVEVWNERPQVLKDIKATVSPLIVMRAAQTVLKPGQVEGFVNKAAQWGVNLSYKGMPVSGQTAGLGYRFAGIDWPRWTPWIIGGGALLFILPMVMKQRR